MHKLIFMKTFILFYFFLTFFHKVTYRKIYLNILLTFVATIVKLAKLTLLINTYKQNTPYQQDGQ